MRPDAAQLWATQSGETTITLERLLSNAAHRSEFGVLYLFRVRRLPRGVAQTGRQEWRLLTTLVLMPLLAPPGREQIDDLGPDAPRPTRSSKHRIHVELSSADQLL